MTVLTRLALCDAAERGLTKHQLAAELCVNPDAVREAAKRAGIKLARTDMNAAWRAEKARKVAARRRALLTERTCMCCRHPFLSAGIQNRMCDPCRRLTTGMDE